MEEKYLFRGKSVETGKFVQGSLVHRTLFYEQPDEKFFIITDGEFHMDHYRAFQVYPDTIDQCVQKKDKNGNLIFEGDILKTKYGRLCEVYFNKDAMCVDLKHINTPDNLETKTHDSFDLWESENLEIVGNIHDGW